MSEQETKPQPQESKPQAQAQPQAQQKPQPKLQPQPQPQPFRWVNVDQNTKDKHGKPLNPGIPEATGKVIRDDNGQKAFVYVSKGQFTQPFSAQTGVSYTVEWYTNQPTQQIGAQSFRV